MFWPDNARLVVSISMQFEAGARRHLTEPGVCSASDEAFWRFAGLKSLE